MTERPARGRRSASRSPPRDDAHTYQNFVRPPLISAPGVQLPPMYVLQALLEQQQQALHLLTQCVQAQTLRQEPVGPHITTPPGLSLAGGSGAQAPDPVLASEELCQLPGFIIEQIDIISKELQEHAAKRLRC
jgi:hypothetical protein